MRVSPAAKVLARESGRPLDIELQQESEKRCALPVYPGVIVPCRSCRRVTHIWCVTTPLRSAMFVAKSLVNTVR